MTNNNVRYAQVVGAAALKLWPDLPRNVQELLFELSVGGDEDFRHELAQHLHDHHPRTAHPRSPRQPRSLFGGRWKLNRACCYSSAAP